MLNYFKIAIIFSGGIKLKKRKQFFRLDSIRDQLRSWVILFTIIMSLFILLPTFIIEYRQTLKDQSEKMDYFLNSQLYFFESWLTERSSDIFTLANLDMVKNYELEKSREFFIEYRDQTDFTDIIFVSKEGFVQFDTVERESMDGVVIDVNDREYFQEAKAGQQQFITDILISKVTGKPILAFASPILDEQHEFNGVVFGTVNLSTIDELLFESRVGFFGHAYIVNQDGTLLTEHIASRNGEANAASEKDFMQNYTIAPHILDIAKENNEKTDYYKNYDGEWVLGASNPINRGNWYLISEVPALEAHTPVYKKMLLIIISILLGAFATIKIMLYFARKFEEPVQELIQGLHNIEKGDYDYKIDESSINRYALEFQELSNALNHMGSKVRENVNLLESLSLSCPLTKLYNRRYLMDHGEIMLHQSIHEDQCCSCIAVDIDYFKNVNDTYGHSVGDEVLKFVAKLMQNTVRKSDIVTRYGGEEFVILLPNTTLNEAGIVAEKVVRVIAENPFIKKDIQIELTVSIGVAERLKANAVTFDQLVDYADQALYISKNTGRNRVQLYESTTV